MATNQNLVNDWKQGYKWISAWCLAFIIYVSQYGVPAELLAIIPEQYHGNILTVAALIGLVMRFVKQPTLSYKKETEE